jgi:phosphoribosylanthranilate isomerase
MKLDVKICGLSTPESVAAALRHGASHVGFIFFDKSPRNVDANKAGALRQAAKGRARAVAVTVDADDARLDHIVATVAPDMLQLHGRETPQRVAALKSRYGLPVIKAIAIARREDLSAIGAYDGVADRFLFDAKPPPGSQLPGGNAVSFDWNILNHLPAGTDYFLAGGIAAENVAEALATAHPAGIDVSSGVESALGIKDLERIAALFAALGRFGQ